MKNKMYSIIGCVVVILMCFSVLPNWSVAVENEMANTSPKIPTTGDVWDGTISQPTKLVQKDGVYYYEITKCAELAYVSQTGGDWLVRNYILGNNLILNDVKLTWDEEGNSTNKEELLDWLPIGSENGFKGVFDGDGYTVSGVYINGGGSEQGLFGYLSSSDAKILNLNVVNSYIYGSYYVGGLVGNKGKATIINCSFSGLVRADGTCAGGIYGYASYLGSVSQCCNYGTIISDHCAGGIGGSGSNDIVRCVNYGNIVKSNATPNDSYHGVEFGGIAGAASDVTFCTNYGSVTGDSMVGGIAGELYEANNCINYGAVSGISYIAGIGTLELDYSSTIDNSYEKCANYGNLTGTGNYVGGITSYAKSVRDILECSNAGQISGNSYCGGLAGYSAGSIQNCYNTGRVSGEAYVGGVLGQGKACQISNCYTIGVVSGHTSTGAVLCSDDAIWGTSIVSGCFYGKQEGLNEDVSGCGDSGIIDEIAGISAYPLSEMKNQSLYLDWDFRTIWSISETKHNGYPYLRWQSHLGDSVPLQGIAIAPSALSMNCGDSCYLSVNTSPQNATPQVIVWCSLTPDIVTVSPTGRVTALCPGTAVVTATTEDNKYTTTCTVTVTERITDEYRINGITVRDNTGIALSSIPHGTCLATISVTNMASAGDTIVVLASYTEDGQYQGMMWVSVEDLPVGSTINVTLPVDNTYGKIANLKAYTVASFTNLIPLGEALSFIQ